MNTHEDGGKLRSYVAALETIHAVRFDVVKVCRTLVEEQLSTFAHTLGVTAPAKEIKDEVLPRRAQQFGEHWAWIGVLIVLVPENLWFSAGLYIDEIDEPK